MVAATVPLIHAAGRTVFCDNFTRQISRAATYENIRLLWMPILLVIAQWLYGLVVLVYYIYDTVSISKNGCKKYSNHETS